MLELADACPHRVSHLVNLDGLPSKNNWPDVADHERTRMVQSEISGWLDHRRGRGRQAARARHPRRAGRRRGRMNPRLELEWLRYLVTIGARHDADGWRWKIDPALRPGGFGPWRPEWSMQRLPGIGVPFLGVLGLEPERWAGAPRPTTSRPTCRRAPSSCRSRASATSCTSSSRALVADLVLELPRHDATDPPAPPTR